MPVSSFSDEAAAERTADHEKKQRESERQKRGGAHTLIASCFSLKNCFIIHWESTAKLCIHCVSVCVGLDRAATDREESFLQHIFNCSTSMSQSGQEEDGQTQRPEVREEDLTEAKSKLGTSGPAKSKTFQVLEECEKMGKTAPSVFSGARSGVETVLNTRSTRPVRK